ncbi:MAG TPA: ferrous iron transport protein B, partial [Prolixibacteraceae bacterium]|nr:ferrous iron transport protein B [Prolixibacteraceae bacterium]
IGWLGEALRTNMPAGALRDLVVDGIIGGVGGVIVFLPNILILFFFISLMEDSGYMSRSAFIMDKLMHKMGLHGKSFIPLIMGFGCNVPAVMATRTLDNRSDRLLTMLIIPFMSCSARLPVYV